MLINNRKTMGNCSSMLDISSVSYMDSTLEFVKCAKIISKKYLKGPAVGILIPTIFVEPRLES